MRWWVWAVLAAAVGAVAWWWFTRAQAAARGELRTIPAPDGAGWSGAVASLLTVGKPGAVSTVGATASGAVVLPAMIASSSGPRCCFPSTVNSAAQASTTAQAAAIQEIADRRKQTAAVAVVAKGPCAAGKKPTQVKTGSTVRVECR